MQFVSESPRELTDGLSFYVVRYRMRRGEEFAAHSHTWPQLMWSPRGTLVAQVGTAVWVLPPTLALWVPPGAVHQVRCGQDAELHSLYFEPDRTPLQWPDPTTVAVPPLLRELLVHLAGPDMTAGERARAEGFLYDLLRPLPAAHLDLPLPRDPRARDVTDALLADPADDRTIEEWGRHVGASSRTLARAFAAETGMTFTTWRTQARLRAALELLSQGAATSAVARRVGYRSMGAFTAAFRRALGTTPQAHRQAASVS